MVLSFCPLIGFEMEWIDGGALEVFLACRKRVHKGYCLLTHPLMGDLHLLQTPFRTVLLGRKTGGIDLISVRWIEESIERVRSLLGTCGPEGALPEEYFKDYQTLDLDLFRNAIRGIRLHGTREIPFDDGVIDQSDKGIDIKNR